jgi:hypothetical protein
MLIKICWIATAVGASLALLTLVTTVGGASGAPQEAAGAATAAAIAIIPYVFARALSEILSPGKKAS